MAHLSPLPRCKLEAFCVFNVAETVDSLGGTGIDVESMAPWDNKMIYSPVVIGDWFIIQEGSGNPELSQDSME